MIDRLMAAADELYPDRIVPSGQSCAQAVRAVALLMGCREPRADELEPYQDYAGFAHEALACGDAWLFVIPNGEMIVGRAHWYERCISFVSPARYTAAAVGPIIVTGPEW